MSHIYDISAPIRTGGVVYPGNPEILIEPQAQVSKGASSNLSLISFGSHTATHVDSERHFFDDGEPVDAIPLEKLIGPALLIAVGDSVRAVTAEVLEKHGIGHHKRVLIRTRNSSLLENPEFVSDYTYLAPDGAEWLVEKGVELVGVDYLSIEQFRSGHHRTHRTLLARKVVIVEGLSLAEPPPGEYELVCLPLRLEGLDGAPARAVLISS
jgi:arylformamidase